MHSRPYAFLFLLFLLSMPFYSEAQYILPNHQSQIIYKNKFLVRWEPREVAEWQHALQRGYQVKVYRGSNRDNLILQSTQTIHALGIMEWDREIANQTDSLMRSFYEGAKSFLYLPPELKEELQVTLAPEEGKSMEQTIEELRLGYLCYAITFNHQLIQKAGLGFALSLEPHAVYRIEVQSGDYPQFVFDYDPRKTVRSKLPALQAEFSDKNVKVKWETPDFKADYFGYFLDLSKDGKQYERVNDMPYVNILDSLKGDPKFRFVTEDIPLEKNYKNYWVRLKGMNYFGLQSRLSSIQKGYGFEIIDAMPTIKHADQTTDNQADIRWSLDDRFNRLIDHFEIYRAGDLDGTYESILTDIPPSQRSILIPMREKRNYFSVAIVPKDGPIIRSFSTFVMGQDTTPPIPPQNFVGSIDSTGILRLSWKQNTEEDLWGYKVFRSEYLNDEFGNLHPSPIQDTLYVDTINLNSITEKIHYTVIALDKRNNRSHFAPIISLERPDTIPPTSPLIRQVTFMEDSIQITWAASSSKDAVLHQLFRRGINESAWELIAEQKSANAINVFVDTLFQYDETYVYTAIAHDDAQQRSTPSRPMKVFTKSRKLKTAFTNFEIDFDREKRRSTIRWDLQHPDLMEEIIVYRGPSREDISMYQVIEPDTLEISQSVDEDEVWYFLFKPILNDGSRAQMSDFILVRQPQ
ncbi:MAG: hypothetical protein AAF985_00220 [Bacteroidota bacterium]